MVNARKHDTPDGSDLTVSRATIFDTFGNSIHDIVPVANVTERALLVTAMTTAGEEPSPSNPLVVSRADASGLHRVEVTFDGSVFVPVSGVLTFASKGDADSFATGNPGLLRASDRAVAGGVAYVWSGAAWVPATGVQALAATQGGNQSVDNNTTTVLTLTGGFADGGITFGDAADTFTVPTTGWYRVSGSVRWSANGTGHRGIGLQVNAVGEAEEDTRVASSFGPTGQSFSTLLQLTAGNTVKMVGRQSSGAALNAGARQLSIELIR